MLLLICNLSQVEGGLTNGRVPKGDRNEGGSKRVCVFVWVKVCFVNIASTVETIFSKLGGKVP